MLVGEAAYRTDTGRIIACAGTERRRKAGQGRKGTSGQRCGGNYDESGEASPICGARLDAPDYASAPRSLSPPVCIKAVASIS
uniref:Uncharacterized protein n=1 Tax=Mycena chlorophos TaxID=658473 RepID=A0ABQ0LMS6_MYCCL|nr:predicted protein [Mycena chlorophos]